MSTHAATCAALLLTVFAGPLAAQNRFLDELRAELSLRIQAGDMQAGAWVHRLATEAEQAGDLRGAVAIATVFGEVALAARAAGPGPLDYVTIAISSLERLGASGQALRLNIGRLEQDYYQCAGRQDANGMLRAVLDLIALHCDAGDFKTAAALAQQVQGAVADGSVSENSVEYNARRLAEEATARWKEGDPAGAVGRLHVVYSLGTSGEQADAALRSMAQTTSVAVQATDATAVRNALVDLIALQEERRSHLRLLPDARREWFEQMQLPYELGLLAAVSLQDGDLLLDLAEHKRARTLLEQLQERRCNFATELPPDLEKRRARIRQLRSRAYAALMARAGPAGDEDRGLYMPIRGAYMPIRDGGNAATESDAALVSLLEQLEEGQAEFERALREQGIKQEIAGTSPPPAAKLRSMVAAIDGLLVLEYSLARGSYVGAAIGGDGQAVTRLVSSGDAASVLENEIDRKVIEFRKAIIDRDAADTTRLGQALYRELVAPFEEHLATATTLAVIPDAGLHLLPFGALIQPDGRPLVERMPVYYTPSLTVLGQARPTRQPPPRSLLALGNPAFATETSAVAGPDDRGAYMPIRSLAATGLLRAMAATALPGTQAEIEGIAQCFTEPQLLSQTAATKQAVLAAADSFRVIHLATHGYADTQEPDYSSILLTPSGPGDPGLLQAFEVYDLRLNADLVTLSACETGVGQTVLGEGVIGLPRAFIFAGAREVLCSLWKVPDEATADLMQAFYRHWTGGQSTGEALRAAKLELAAAPDTVAPFYWAAFVLIEGPQG